MALVTRRVQKPPRLSVRLPFMRTILLFDDDTVLREQLQHVLEAEGYRVIASPNGAEALALYRKMAPPIWWSPISSWTRWKGSN